MPNQYTSPENYIDHSYIQLFSEYTWEGVLSILLICKCHLLPQIILLSVIHIRQNPFVLLVEVVVMPTQEQYNEA
jgi:hypothetical protein